MNIESKTNKQLKQKLLLWKRANLKQIGIRELCTKKISCFEIVMQ